MVSLLWKEIHEQPEVIRRLIAGEHAHILRLGRALREKPRRFVYLAARGTSDNAARYGQYLFGGLNRLPVALSAPSLFTAYQTPPHLEEALVIGISQSGQSPDIVEVLEDARRQGAPTVAITNDADSPLAFAAEHLLTLSAGREQSVAATKTYTATLAVLAMLSLAMEDGLREESLAPVAPWMDAALRIESQAQAAAERIADSSRAVVLGRGYQYCTAHEISLKIKELSGVEAEPYSSADFKHGPIAVAEDGLPVIVISEGTTFRREMGNLADLVRAQGARVLPVADELPGIQPADIWIPLPHGEPEWLTPIATVVPGQLLAFHLARARGMDPDRPPHIRKVTLTH
jgi:glucosamine--fructose-6-phosphate aminotransferase (isomerizing)